MSGKNLSPIFVHMLGLPGVGKSSFVQLLQARLQHYQPVIVSFDGIMQAMPDYQALAAKDAVAAFAQFESVAREAGYALLEQSMQQLRNIIFDHGGANNAHINYLQQAKAAGYKIILCYMPLAIPLAAQRIAARAEQRHTPSHYLTERAGVLTTLLPSYRQLADIFYEIDNSAEASQLAAQADHLKQQL